MRYYDDGCAAHATLKEGVKSLGAEGVMTVYYEPSVTRSL